MVFGQSSSDAWVYKVREGSAHGNRLELDNFILIVLHVLYTYLESPELSTQK